MPAEKSSPGREKKPRESFPPAQNLAFIAASAHAIANTANMVLRDTGAKLGLADWSLLVRLSASAEPMPMGRVARQMGVSRQRIQKQVDELVGSGMVDARTQDDDKRARLLSLTKEGRKTLAETTELWTQEMGKNMPAQFAKLDGVRRRLATVSTLLVKGQRPAKRADGKNAREGGGKKSARGPD